MLLRQLWSASRRAALRDPVDAALFALLSVLILVVSALMLLAAIDCVQEVRAERAAIACESARMRPRRLFLTHTVICVPPPLTLTVQAVPR